MMNRRQFTKIAGLGALGVGTGQINHSQTARGPQIAITMDDFNWRNAVHQTATERNKSTLDTLQAHSIKAALFVVGRNVESDEGKGLLSEWNTAGHLIGNHTYSHQNFNAPNVTLQQYEDDVLRAEIVLKTFSGFRRYFRFPMLKEGDTATKRDGLRSFLTKNGYRVGHVTIDTSDWVISARLTERLTKEPSADPKPYREFYLEHMWDRAQYYDSLARRVLARSVKHTLLVHYNLLNGLFLGDLIQMFKSKGWEFIDAEEAFADPIFSKKPNVLPAGESIVWAIAKSDGAIARSLKYPAEDGEAVVTQMKQRGL